MPDTTLLGAADSSATTTAAATTAASATAAATTTTPTGFVADDGNFRDGWLDRLPEDLKPAHQTLAKYRGLPDLAKSHFELQQMLGKKSSAVNVPTDKSTAEEIAAFRKAIGAPEKPEDYKLKPEKLPDGIEWNADFEKGVTTIAAKHNISAVALKELSDFYLATETARGEELKSIVAGEITKGEEALKTAWGGNYDKNRQLAVRVAQTVGLDVNSSGLRDPEVVKALVRFGGMMSEDKLVTGEFSPSLHAGKTRANDIMTNKTNPLYEKYQNGDRETVELVRSLIKNG